MCLVSISLFSQQYHLETICILFLFRLSSVAILFLQTLKRKNEILKGSSFIHKLFIQSIFVLQLLVEWNADFTVKAHFEFPINQALSISFVPCPGLMFSIICSFLVTHIPRSYFHSPFVININFPPRPPSVLL